LLACGLAGCSSVPSAINPVDWWHGLEGGPVAEQRPPPPNADAPYPNLATVPPKPQPPDAATQQRIASGLIADRANANYEASQSPLPDPSSRTASPALFGGSAPPPPPVDPNAASATMDAASASPAASKTTVGKAVGPTIGAFSSGQPAQGTASSGTGTPSSGASATPQAHPQPSIPDAPAAPPSRAPRGSVESAPLPNPQPAVGAQSAAGPAPEMPNAPPAPPRIAGVSVPPTAPTAPPVAPPKPSAPGAPLSGNEAAAVPVSFPLGSAVLPSDDNAALSALAARRGAHAIAVTGFGEATESMPAKQSAGLTLALARARAIAAALTADGVPASVLRIDAQAAGRGGAARLLN
jgi:outer membrane protein OmpA-like peptidoglycan-associated protein